MESKAQVLGHSLHQILVAYPLGLLTTSFGFDIVALLLHDARWTAMSYYVMLVGLLGGMAAIVFGYIDYRAIPADTRAKRIGRLHGWGGLVVMLLFGLSAFLRTLDPFKISTIAFVCSLAGILAITITGWLGGELVGRMGVGVADHAHLDMPSAFAAQQALPSPQVAGAKAGVTH